VLGRIKSPAELENAVQTDDSDGVAKPRAMPLPFVPAVGRLRLITLESPHPPQRRRTPRRRLVQAVSFDRRRADRRSAKPGIDGLLRTVLADDWR
jgi:hypothetical protein